MTICVYCMAKKYHFARNDGYCFRKVSHFKTIFLKKSHHFFTSPARPPKKVFFGDSVIIYV
jgi:hypothetical protein